MIPRCYPHQPTVIFIAPSSPRCIPAPRRVHFVEERGWHDLTIVDGGEYDAFDDDQTIYFLALGPDAEVLGSIRARPTIDKCMLRDAFPELIGFTTEAGERS